MHAREPIAARQIAAHLLIQRSSVKEPVEVNQHRVSLIGQFGTRANTLRQDNDLRAWGGLLSR